MQRVTCHGGRLRIEETGDAAWGGRLGAGHTGVVPLLERGFVHELLVPAGLSRLVAVVLSSTAGAAGAFVWCGDELEPYPPALAAAGVSLDRVYLLRPQTRADLLWSAAESLRCPGVGVTIVAPGRLTPVEARQLQLAAERGGGLGLLIRSPGALVHAARTRWLVRAERGKAFVQRWSLQRIHGHGGPTDQSLTLEIHRETNHVRAASVLADRSRQTTSARTA